MMEGGHYRKFYIIVAVFTGAAWHDNGGSHDRECAGTCFVGAALPHDVGGHYRKFYITCFAGDMRPDCAV